MKRMKDERAQNNLSQYPTHLNEREEMGKNKRGLFHRYSIILCFDA
jgi:hypothetical protein